MIRGEPQPALTARGGTITATNGNATLPVPPNLLAGTQILTVRSYNNSHNLSSAANLYLRVAPYTPYGATTKNRIEVENTVTAPALCTTSIPTPCRYTEARTVSSAGAQLHIVATAAGQVTTMAFTTPATGNYALELQGAACNHYATFSVKVDGQDWLDQNGSIATYSPSSAPGANACGSQEVNFNLGSTAARINTPNLSQGTHTLTITTVAPGPVNYHQTTLIDTYDNGYSIGIDYLRLTHLP